MIRRALVAMDGSPHGAAAATLAIEWGRRFDAQLIGLGILDKPSITAPQPVPLGGTAFKHHRDEALLADAHRRVIGVLAAFQRECSARGVRCAVVEDVGAPHEQIVSEAAGCDVVVLGRESHFQFETQEEPDATLSKVLRESPRPVVVVPRESTTGTGALVAYGSGREVARTLQTFALLGVVGEETLHLVAIDPDPARAAVRLHPARQFLEAHGVRVTLHPVGSRGNPVDIIRDEVRRLRPRLVVMGAHGHHPVRDLFFTSVTRAVLAESPVPVFVGA